MQVERKGFGDAIRLRLNLNEKTTEQLRQIISQRDPENTRRYLHDAKTRNAAMVVLRVRGAMAEPL